MAQSHAMEHPGQTQSRRQSTRAHRIRTSRGPQRKEDKRKEPKQEQPRRKEQAGNKAHRSGEGGRGQPPWAGSSGDEASGPRLERHDCAGRKMWQERAGRATKKEQEQGTGPRRRKGREEKGMKEQQRGPMDRSIQQE